jgi:hypothetical protein
MRRTALETYPDVSKYHILWLNSAGEPDQASALDVYTCSCGVTPAGECQIESPNRNLATPYANFIAVQKLQRLQGR